MMTPTHARRSPVIWWGGKQQQQRNAYAYQEGPRYPAIRVLCPQHNLMHQRTWAGVALPFDVEIVGGVIWRGGHIKLLALPRLRQRYTLRHAVYGEGDGFGAATTAHRYIKRERFAQPRRTGYHETGHRLDTPGEFALLRAGIAPPEEVVQVVALPIRIQAGFVAKLYRDGRGRLECAHKPERNAGQDG